MTKFIIINNNNNCIVLYMSLEKTVNNIDHAGIQQKNTDSKDLLWHTMLIVS